jgi:hypothetical protein
VLEGSALLPVNPLHAGFQFFPRMAMRRSRTFPTTEFANWPRLRVAPAIRPFGPGVGDPVCPAPADNGALLMSQWQNSESP